MKNEFVINLLPNELRLKRLHQKRLQKTVFLIFVLTAIFIAINCIIWSISFSYSLNQLSLKDNIKSTETEIAKMQGTEEKLEQLNYKFMIAQSVENDTLKPETILNELAKTTPANVVLTDLDIDLSKQPQITLQGTTDERRSVIIFTEAINNNPLFSNAETTSVSNASKDSSNTGVIFNISATLKGITK